MELAGDTLKDILGVRAWSRNWLAASRARICLDCWASRSSWLRKRVVKVLTVREAISIRTMMTLYCLSYTRRVNMGSAKIQLKRRTPITAENRP